MIATLGAEAPVNGTIVALAHQIERGDLDPASANLELLRTLADQVSDSR